jgi:hypothetical protein
VGHREPPSGGKEITPMTFLRSKTTLAVAALTLLLAGALLGSTVREAFARQVRMENALSLLQQARGELQEARANKGGHRVRAIQAVDVAIGEVRQGMAFADD